MSGSQFVLLIGEKAALAIRRTNRFVSARAFFPLTDSLYSEAVSAVDLLVAATLAAGLCFLLQPHWGHPTASCTEQSRASDFLLLCANASTYYRNNFLAYLVRTKSPGLRFFFTAPEVHVQHCNYLTLMFSERILQERAASAPSASTK